jgi:hypothetical protein
MSRSKPIVCTWLQLAEALAPLHGWDKRYLDRLHDVWKLGAPTPDSHILVPAGYDERKLQPGNTERRIVAPSKLEAWVVEVAQARGWPMTMQDACEIIEGRGYVRGQARSHTRR